MKRYPLQTLVRLREHRTEAARMLVLERQRAAQACRDACTKIEGEIIALQFEQKQQRSRLLVPPPPGVPWSSALAQREAARQRLFKAQAALRDAENALAEARTAFFRAKARQDALEKRRDLWRGEQFVIDARREEDAAEDLQQARHLART
jgi:hypothetical protein